LKIISVLIKTLVAQALKIIISSNSWDMKRYNFYQVDTCEMCGDKTHNHVRLGQRLDKSQGLNPNNRIGVSVSVNKCTKCGLIYSIPQPVPFSIQDHYGIPAEDYWKPEYFQWSSEYFSQQIAIAKKILPFANGMKALDIGCGLGKTLLSLEHNGFNAYGIEPSETFYDKAVSLMNIHKDKIKCCSIENAEFSNNKFNFITFGAVFEHLYHPHDALENAVKWSKPEGIIHIEVPSSRNLNSRLINFYYKIRGTNFVTNLSPMHAPFHLFEFDIRSFYALEEKMGFKVVKFTYDIGNVYHIPKIFHGLIKFFMHISNTGNQLTVYLKKNSETH